MPKVAEGLAKVSCALWDLLVMPWQQQFASCKFEILICTPVAVSTGENEVAADGQGTVQWFWSEKKGNKKMRGRRECTGVHRSLI